MGPNLIIDKSGFEQLSVAELDLLDCYFHIIIPPIFVLEVLGNLAQKPDERPKRQTGNPENRVSAFARKVGLNSSVTMDYRRVCLLTLIGYEFGNNRGCIPYQSRPVESTAGYQGIIIEDSEIDEAIRRWERREFTVDDRTAAELRKAACKRLEIDAYRELFKRHRVELGKPRNLNEVGELVNSLMQDERIQYGLLYILFKEIDVPNKVQGKLNGQWMKLHKSQRYLKTLSHYAAFCIKANLALVVAALAGLVNHEETSGSDIEYCYYLPRCNVFVSGDKLHKRIHSLLLDPDQTFLSAQELKEDLKRRVELGLNIAKENQNGPTEIGDSVVNKLWAKYSYTVPRPQNPLPLDTLLVSTTPDGNEITETFQQFLERKSREIDEGNYPAQLASGEPTFVKRSRKIAISEIERKFGREAAQQARDSLKNKEE